MEQLDLFESEKSKAQKLFNKFGIKKIEFNQKYIIKAKSGSINNRHTVRSFSSIGKLIRYDNDSIALSDVWITKIENEQKQEQYAEFIIIEINDVQKIEEYSFFDAPIGMPYRAELYKSSSPNKSTKWISCYYRGVTLSNKIVLIDFSNSESANEILLCEKRDIKGFFPLTLETVQENEEK